MTIEEIKEKLKRNLSKKRYIHSLGVATTAKEIARRYNYDIKKAEIAALLHDCAKEYNYIEYKNKTGFVLSDDIVKYKTVIHSFLGADVAKREYEIYDDEILNAIRYHTTARPNMTKLDKIIYIADGIEPNRPRYTSVVEARKLIKIDLDLTYEFMVENVLEYLKNKHLKICDLTRQAYMFNNKKNNI